MKQGRFRYTLDDYTVLADEPRGWEDAEIVVERSDDYSGLFINYMTELEFWGDGFAYLKNQINVFGYCAAIKINIEYQCNRSSEFEKVFEGFINMPNTEIDLERCTIKANIEPDDIYAAFLKTSDKEIDLYNQLLYEGNPPLKLPYGGSIPGVADFLTISSVSGTSGSNGYAFKVSNTLDFLAKYYSNGRISVVSDYFTVQDDFQPEIYELVFSGQIVAGQQIEITYQNYFGNTYTSIQPFFLGHEVTVRAVVNDLITKDKTSTAGTISLVVIQAYDESKFAYGIHDFTDPNAPITLHAWLPFKIISAVVTGPGTPVTITVTKTQDWNQGNAYDTYLYFNVDQQNGTDPTEVAAIRRKISFKKLFTDLDKLYNIGLQLQKVGDDYQMRIEPKLYFYGQTVTMRITGPINMKQVYSEDGKFTSVNTGTNATYDTPSGYPDRYSASNACSQQLYQINTCIGDTLDLVADINFDITKQGDQTYSIPSTQEGEYSIIKTEEFIGATVSRDYPASVAIYDPPNSVYIIEQLIFYNANITNTNQIINHGSMINGECRRPSTNQIDFPNQVYAIPNVSTLKPFTSIQFEYFLSFSEMISLIENPQDTVEVDIKGEFVKCWIQKISMKINTKKTTFEVYRQE